MPSTAANRAYVDGSANDVPRLSWGLNVEGREKLRKSPEAGLDCFPPLTGGGWLATVGRHVAAALPTSRGGKARAFRASEIQEFEGSGANTGTFRPATAIASRSAADMSFT